MKNPNRPQPCVALLLAVAMMVSSLSACHRTKNSGDNSAASTASSADEKTLSDDLFSYELSIDGHVYSLPCPVSEFEEHGWVIDDDREIKPGDPFKVFLLERADNEEISLGVDLYNPTAEIMEPSGSFVVGVYLQPDKGYDVILPGGFAFDSSISYDDIMKQYGEPDSTFDEESYIARYYIQTYYHEIGFFGVPDESGRIENISAYVLNRTFEKDLSILDRSKIQKVDIADELDSCQVWIEGNLCTVPMKFNEFTDYGWKVKEDSSISYVKNDTEIWIGTNDPDNTTPPQDDSLITEFYISLRSGAELVILPGNFIFDKRTTVEEIIDQYGQPYELQDFGNSYHLHYKLNQSGSSFVTFFIAREDNAAISPEERTVIIRKTPGE